MKQKKVLIIITSHTGDWKIPRKTGYWLGEVTHFYDVLTKNGFECSLASPKGGEPPLDIKSIQSIESFDQVNKKYLNDASFTDKLKNTIPISKIQAEEYNSIYYAGGHGCMWDFPNDPILSNLATKIYESNGIVSSVCHGSAGLINIKLSNGELLIKNKEVTGFANIEESLIGLTNLVPYLLENKLKESGGIYKKSFLPYMPFAVSKDRLITGQNPYSAKKVANLVLKELTRR